MGLELNRFAGKVALHCAVLSGVWSYTAVQIVYSLCPVDVPGYFSAISFGELGGREVTLVYLFGSVGMAAKLSASSGLIFHAWNLSGSFLG